MMKPIQTSIILVLGLLATTGCSLWQSMCPSGVTLSPSDSVEYSNCPPPPPPPPSLRDQLAAAQKQNATLSSRVSDLERQLADRDREIASLRSGAGDSSRSASQLSSAQRDLNLSNARAADLERQLAASQALAAGGLATDKQRIADLEKQLAERDKELDGLRGELSAEMTKLKEAQRRLIPALRPQIEKGDITVDLNNERLLINLASGYLFGSGQDELKPAGADALKQVGAVLKDFPEYKVAVDGHTDNVAIRGALKKKFPSNMELSESRAANAAKALTEGGLGAATTHGYADTKPVEPNTTEAGRAKNRRVEVRVT
ncbi:MAG: OmpA family protein, partial [Nitrospirae bacterium]|nr:OmpA family protein [Nitrospirota bacterium]